MEKNTGHTENKEKLIFSPDEDYFNLGQSIAACIRDLSPSSVLIVSDSNVTEKVLPDLLDNNDISKYPVAVLTAGEEHKELNEVIKIWNLLEKSAATRRSLIVNIGGGMVCDMGGFAAATFKRGIRYINVPTTLLAQTDAAIGGKTGINFNGLKNEIGAFHSPVNVLISSAPLKTLPEKEILSGYGELLKTALIGDQSLYEELVARNPLSECKEGFDKIIFKAASIKEEIVELDPLEKGLRKVLNFGHTAGHAFESFNIFTLKQELPHGIAVAHGILVALILSNMLKDLDLKITHGYAEFLKKYFPRLHVNKNYAEQIINIMGYDKKNSVQGEPEFTLIESPGEPLFGIKPGRENIKKALGDYFELTAV